MGRSRTELPPHRTEGARRFREYCADANLAEIARQCGITREYARLLAQGKHAPAIVVGVKIAALTHGKVPVESWAQPAVR
jgi:hypothetical protein